MTQDTSYRLGRYEIIAKGNGEIWWETHAGFGRLRAGKCFIVEEILFIGPYEIERPGFLIGEFLEHLSKLPKWEKTRHYCSSYTIYDCESGRISPNFGAGGDAASKTQTKSNWGRKEKYYKVHESKPLHFTKGIVKIKESGAAIWRLIKDRFLKVFFVLILLVLSILPVVPDLVMADDDKTNKRHYKRYENSKKHRDYDDHKRQRVRKDDEGNETTGQTAAWLLAAANLTVALSILIKGAGRRLPLNPQMQNAFKRFNQFQKKHLMRFHYVLNPIALGMALLHFGLSSCRSSQLPEGGLVLVAVMVLLGLILKFKLSPKGMRKSVYGLHTTPAIFLITIFVLVAGHLIVD